MVENGSRHLQVVEGVGLECPDGLGEETGADEQEEVRHHDHEDGERCTRRSQYRKYCSANMWALTGPASERVDEVTTDETADETDDGGNRDSGCGLAERDTANEDDGLHTWAKRTKVSPYPTL